MRVYCEARFEETGPWRVVVALCLKEGDVEEAKKALYSIADEYTKKREWFIASVEARAPMAVSVLHGSWEKWETDWSMEKQHDIQRQTNVYGVH